MKQHIFARWQVSLCALVLLAEGLYLPQSREGWLALLLSAAAAAVLLPLLMKLPNGLRSGVCALLALLLPIQSVLRLYSFWSYAGLNAAIAAILLLATAWLLSGRGADCLFMWSFPAAVTAALLLLLSAAVTVPDWDFSHLTIPVPSNLAKECLRTLPGFLALFLPAQLSGEAKAPAKGILLGGVLLSLLSLRTLLLLGGAPCAYPSYAAASLAAVGDFLRRCEVVFAAVLSLCECTRIAVCLTFLRTKGSAP